MQKMPDKYLHADFLPFFILFTPKKINTASHIGEVIINISAKDSGNHPLIQAKIALTGAEI
jgi:hypothetical protein